MQFICSGAEHKFNIIFCEENSSRVVPLLLKAVAVDRPGSPARLQAGGAAFAQEGGGSRKYVILKLNLS